MTFRDLLLVIVFLVLLVIVTEQTSINASSGGLLGTIEGALGMKLPASEIAQYAAGAGFFGDDLVTAVAVALAESGGNPKAYNPETQAGTPEGKGSFGLWQIYLYKHQEFAMLDLYEPAANAAAAFSVYAAAGNSFRPWSTFSQDNPKTGEPWYTAHVSDAQAGVDSLPGTVSA